MILRATFSLATAFAVGSFSCLGAGLSAQQPVPSVPARAIRAGTGVLLELPAAGRPPESANVGAPAPAPQDPTQVAAAAAVANARLQKLKQTFFDRRPSVILQAWAAPELRPYDPAEELAKAAKEREQAAAGGSEPVTAPVARLAPEEVRQAVIEELGVDPGELQRNLVAEAAAAGMTEAVLAEKRLQREFEMLQRAVTLGRWVELGAFLQTFDEKLRKDAYEQILRVLPTPPPPTDPRQQQVPQNLQEKNHFAFEDAFVLAGLAPGGFHKKQIPLLMPIVRRSIDSGSVLEELVRLLAVEAGKPAAEARIDRRQAALLLVALGHEIEIGAFLPTAEEAEQKNDREALNLLARHALARFQKEKRTIHLESAWRVTQAALAKGEVGDEEKAEALRRAVELAPKVQKDLGPAWLAQSFTERPDRGMEIVATIGGQVAKGFQERAQDPAFRGKGLELQKTAVDALLREAPQLAELWRPTLGLLAVGWITEAAWSYQNSQSDSMGPVMQRDEFGNIFWSNMRRGGAGMVQPIEPVDLLQAQPGPAWAALLDQALQPHFLTVSAQLYLKVNEAEKAFPFIEQLALVNPRKARELADEFLRVWTRKANPNQRQTNSYMYMYGFDMRSNGIPLTRSKQERNLAELGSWVERLRQLPIGGVDEQLLTTAFTTAHSVAEVYRMESIERVFGDVAALDPVLLGELLGKMRTNLATVWRLPAVQEGQKTRRSQKEMLAEVERGYETALAIGARAAQKHGSHWALMVATASLLHDGNNFRQELSRSSDFAAARRAAFELFERAAADYCSKAPGLRLDEESLRAFDTWFYAALGACDLGGIDESTIVAKNQLPAIRAALAALPDGSRERHEGMFANALFTRMAAVKPQIKHRYLDGGFQIVGDHPQAAEAKKVFDYYQDLLAELRLEAVVDGPAEVGTEPFGVRVDIVHSPEIERESGGFAKYALNQNNQNYAYNYGRPLENYRDRFQDAVNGALGEHFEVLSVTWNGEQMASKPSGQAAWRRTPYAWILLKARGPQVDRIPAIQLDFDFLDTSGYAVLPIGTFPVPIDATQRAAVARPFRDLAVAQILDERKAGDGKITLEVKATATGLVPELDEFLDLDVPGFRVDKSDDQGASVVKFTEEQDSVQTERSWLLTLVPAGEGALPPRFVFGKPSLDGITATYQRYDDADLATVAPEIALLRGHGNPNPAWAWVLVGVAACAFLLWFLLWPIGGRGAEAPAALLHMPARITPFTVLGLLHEVGKSGKLDAAKRRELALAIDRVEQVHFGRAADPALDLKRLAEEWLRAAC